MIELSQISLSKTEWLPCWRIIASRFPPVDLFERVATVEEFNMALEIEQLTNPRVRNELREILLVPPEESVFGPGASYIMAPFTHLAPTSHDSRFSDGTYGIYYAGDSLKTAISETKYHKEKWLKSFNAPRIELDMRVLLADLKASLHDITGMQTMMTTVYHLTDYSASQNLGRQLRQQGSEGIRYNSVRNLSGQCAAVFKPRVLSHCRQERHLCYVWNGSEISTIYRKTAVTA